MESKCIYEFYKFCGNMEIAKIYYKINSMILQLISDSGNSDGSYMFPKVSKDCVFEFGITDNILQKIKDVLYEVPGNFEVIYFKIAHITSFRIIRKQSIKYREFVSLN
jgi:hypothetical protein